MIKNHELQDDVTLCTTVPRVRGELLSLRVGGVGWIFVVDILFISCRVCRNLYFENTPATPHPYPPGD